MSILFWLPGNFPCLLRAFNNAWSATSTALCALQMCLLASLTTAQRNERVLYFDTTNSFNAIRLASMYNSIQPEPGLQRCSLEATLANITLVRTHCVFELLGLLDAFIHRMGVFAADGGVRPQLLVLDSVSGVVSPVLGGAQQAQGHALMLCVARMLKQAADAFSIAVLVTNHMVSGGARYEGPAGAGIGQPDKKPALGEGWRSQAHVRVQLSRAEDGSADNGGRLATLKSSTLMPCGQVIMLQLCEQGTLSHD